MSMMISTMMLMWERISSTCIDLRCHLHHLLLWVME
uniref:Uncharacterized protein MANES_13G019800 n=1 Tax=Rhizophora mucronata TaxID=61149 RepID=A0A2P2QXU4_RHIMU